MTVGDDVRRIEHLSKDGGNDAVPWKYPGFGESLHDEAGIGRADTRERGTFGRPRPF
jgi:hypothetical protein